MKTIYQILFAYLLISNSAASAMEPLILPGAVRLEGVGAVYGVVAGAKNLYGDSIDLLAGASFGEIQAQGALISNIPLGVDWLTLAGGYANLSEVHLDTKYVRGLQSGPTYRQEMSGNAMGAAISVRLIPDQMKLAFGYAKSEINLDDFSVSDRKINRPNKGGYFPIKTDSQSLSIEYKSFTAAIDNWGWMGLAAVTTATGRTGQSDTLTTDFKLAGYWRAHPKILLVQANRWSDAMVTKEDTNYKTSTQVATALNTGCSGLADTTERNDCATFETYLSEYIAQNNNHGLAVPMGGSQGVRSQDELSLRAGHTRLASFEAQYDISDFALPGSMKSGDTRLSVTPFYDLGWANDKESKVFDKAVQAYGIGLRMDLKNLPIRLSYAESKTDSAWFLAAGSSF